MAALVGFLDPSNRTVDARRREALRRRARTISAIRHGFRDPDGRAAIGESARSIAARWSRHKVRGRVVGETPTVIQDHAFRNRADFKERPSIERGVCCHRPLGRFTARPKGGPGRCAFVCWPLHRRPHCKGTIVPDENSPRARECSKSATRPWS